MTILRLLVFLGALCGAAGASAADITVLPLGGRASPSTRAELTESLRAELTGLGFNVQSKAATAQVLADAAAFGNSCSVTVSSCAIQMGSLAGVRTVVSGVVDDGQLSLKATDVATEREIGRVVLPVDPAAPLLAVRLAAVRLMRPAEEVGGLMIIVDVVGAAVSVDGQPRGVSPLASLSVSPGRHEVYVSHFDHDGQTFVVDVELGATTTLEVALRPDGVRPTRPSRPSGPVSEARPPPEPGRIDASTPIIVLDVEPPRPPRRETNLMAALLTVGVVEELRRRREDPLSVATPTDVARLLGEEGRADLDRCPDDACIVTRLEKLWPRADVVIVSVARTGEQYYQVNAGRYAVGGNGRRLTGTGGTPEQVVTSAAWLVDDLFPGELEAPAGEAPDLASRLAARPVSVPLFAATAGGVVVGAAVAVGSAVGYANAGDDATTSLGWGIGMVTGAVVAAGCLTSTIIEVMFVDWGDHKAANDELLAEVESRGYSRR